MVTKILNTKTMFIGLFALIMGSFIRIIRYSNTLSNTLLIIGLILLIGTLFFKLSKNYNFIKKVLSILFSISVISTFAMVVMSYFYEEDSNLLKQHIIYLIVSAVSLTIVRAIPNKKIV